MAVTGNLSYYGKRQIIDLIPGGQAYTPPTGIFLQLYQSAIDYSATGGWPGAIGAQFSATNNLENWITGLTASGTGYKVNAVDFVFPTATADWGTAQFFMVKEAAAAAGEPLYWGELATAKVVASGDVIRFPSGSLAIRHT